MRFVVVASVVSFVCLFCFGGRGVFVYVFVCFFLCLFFVCFVFLSDQR